MCGGAGWWWARQAASLKLEVGALRSRLQVTEKKLQEVLLQLQDMHQRHGARPLSHEERQRCMQLVTAFTQVGHHGSVG